MRGVGVEAAERGVLLSEALVYIHEVKRRRSACTHT